MDTDTKIKLVVAIALIIFAFIFAPTLMRDLTGAGKTAFMSCDSSIRDVDIGDMGIGK